MAKQLGNGEIFAGREHCLSYVKRVFCPLTACEQSFEITTLVNYIGWYLEFLIRTLILRFVNGGYCFIKTAEIAIPTG